jgi:hypothetical protein
MQAMNIQAMAPLSDPRTKRFQTMTAHFALFQE